MGIKKYLGLERRHVSRYPVSLECEFYVWDAVDKRPKTRTVPGRLTDISHAGACLQSNHTIIDGHHLLLDSDLEGKTPLVLLIKPGPEIEPVELQARVLWYNRVSGERTFQFDIGLQFAAATENLETLQKLIKLSPEAR